MVSGCQDGLLHCSLDPCAAGFGGSVQVPPRLLGLQESQQISGKGFECLKQLEEKNIEKQRANSLFLQVGQNIFQSFSRDAEAKLDWKAAVDSW